MGFPMEKKNLNGFFLRWSTMLAISRLISRIMQAAFTKIYDKQVWKNGSGVGSTPHYNEFYMNFLHGFLKEKSIKTVLDIGCGDWQFSKFIDWTGIDYNGIDVVQHVVDYNNDHYGRENIKFFHMDATITKLPGEFDLVIIKDVLQHWSNETIIEFMNKLTKQGHKHILITNTATSNFYKNTNKGVNRSIDNKYHYAKLDATDYPLNQFNPTVVGNYKFKQVSLISS